MNKLVCTNPFVKEMQIIMKRNRKHKKKCYNYPTTTCGIRRGDKRINASGEYVSSFVYTYKGNE